MRFAGASIFRCRVEPASSTDGKLGLWDWIADAAAFPIEEAVFVVVVEQDGGTNSPGGVIPPDIKVLESY